MTDACQSRTSVESSAGDSITSSFFSVSSVITVSGVASIATMCSGFRWIGSSGWVRRWTLIIGFLDCDFGWTAPVTAPSTPYRLLAVQVDQRLQHLVGGRDHAA